METFEQNHVVNGNPRDGRVTLDEFMEYYANVGATIDSDEYFSIMMNNSWNVTGNALTY